VAVTANILVVDDKPENLLAVEATLEPLGQRLVFARSGHEALRAVLHDDFAVILLDVQMPTLDGLETASLIKQRERSRYTPIIFVTANDREMSGVMRAYEQGAVDILFKPFHPEILRSKVSVFVELFAQRERLRVQEEQLRRQEREQAAREEKETQERRLNALFEEMPAIIGVLRAPDQVYVLTNPRLNALHAGRSLLGMAVRDAHPELASSPLFEELDRVFSTGEPYRASDFRVDVALQDRGDGSEAVARYFDFTFQPMRNEGRVDSVIVFATEVTDQVLARQKVEAAERRIAFLAEASSVLASSLDHRATLVELANLAVPEIADACAVDVLEDDGTIRRVATAFRHPGAAETSRRLALAHPPRASDEEGVGRVLRLGEPRLLSVVSEDSQAGLARDPEHLAMIRSLGLRSVVAVPLVANKRTIGVLSLAYTAESGRRYQPNDLAFAAEIGRRATHAIENARLFEAERAGRERLALLAEASATLASSLDHETTLRSVARLAVPALGDYSFFEVLDEDGMIRRAGFAHRDAASAELLERLPRPAQSYVEEHPVARALISGRPQMITDVSDAYLARITPEPDQLARIKQLRPRSIVCVPLVSRQRAIGALMLVFSDSERVHSGDDLHLAEEIARRAAMALDNARLFADSQDAIRHRDDFLSIASHELNTPLTPLKMQIAMLRRGIGVADADSKLAMADRQVDRMTKLISRLLDVSRIVGGRLSLDPEPVNLAGVLREVTAQFRDEAEKQGSELRLRAEGEAVGNFDRVRVEQVVVNLVTNAIKYGSGNPIDLELIVRNDRARILVRDRGIGIEPRMQARIFDRFERAVSSRHYGGFGLGLWIARQIVEASGGVITVDSTPGEGSVFAIELPLSHVSANSNGSDEIPAPPPA
jgi:signal transduction histidine kinase/CheY-like chemotaxis protein